MWLNFLLVSGVATFAAGLSGPTKFNRPRVATDQEITVSDALISRFSDPIDGVSYRLPNTTTPLHYDIWLTTDIHRGDFNFDGRVTIKILALQNTTEITLHYRQLTIKNVRLLREGGGTMQANVPFTLIPFEEFLVATPRIQLTEGVNYWVEITYNGTLRDDDAGFYRSSYINPSDERVWLATTQFESTDARHAFPW